jgi:hypothetical protein
MLIDLARHALEKASFPTKVSAGDTHLFDPK